MNTQIEYLRRQIGFNLSEIAEILDVSRPTIHEWLESVEPLLGQGNGERLDSLYRILLLWKEKNLGRISLYLNKRIKNEQDSLFSLLKQKELDKKRIHNIMNWIAQEMHVRREKKNAHEKFLKENGFEEVSKEAREENLNNFIQDSDLYERHSGCK